MNIDALFLTALDSSAPVLIFIALGAVFNLVNLVPGKHYKSLNNITFKFALTISAIYTIGRQDLTVNDLKIVAALILVTIVGLVVVAPLAFLYKKEERFHAYASISAIVLLNNAVFSGIPVFSGIYGATLTDRFAFLQMLVLFSFALLFIYLAFEYAEIQTELAKNKDCALNNISSRARFGKTCAICLKKTFLQPLIIAIIISIVYNILARYIKFLAPLPIYLSNFFKNFSQISAPLGLLSLGMFAAELVKSKKSAQASYAVLQTPIAMQIVAFVVICVLRSFALPLVFLLICKMLKIEELSAEINAAIYSSPSATFSYALCDEYEFGAGWAGLQCSLGIIVSMFAIPVIQIASKAIYSI
ncbi:Membrane transport family protein [Spironucleus salmonicida]|uniref:Membrane transport family protein n=1 Tax=Spironucleus salmonicida TaxID=348837 RepID=V6LKU6_9EUKA|nr:Membrane transport family protein [Spironucleus salmonicida]|eukprot:EST44361.1 Membrane transport family protein [Spironucleus salmonicida]